MPIGVVLNAARQGQPHDLVAAHPGAFVHRTGLQPPELHSGFGAGDKERSGRHKAKETLKIDVAAIHHIERLVKKSFEEAKQLFGNRLSSQVILRGPAKDEIASFLERRCLTFDRPETANLAAAIIETESVRLGNWRFVTRIARQCWDRFGSNPITLDKFGQALAAAKDTCVLSYQGPRQ